ncbi:MULTISPECIES: amidohydrolase [Enterococcus]|uniref:amidohydrolase n=1 Tax=Enterococcus TaxID=1350 RepID=UPI00249EF50B|nr:MULTISPECIES: amidohydrolase [Enterococcus]MDT2740090.1 amidohydrolase [Enterococcus canintestini]WHA09004.1 amidohydrolase [Enterococcus montenegrensis]
MDQLQKLFLEKISLNEQTAYDLNDDLAAHPEISGQEFRSVKKIIEILKAKEIAVTENVAGLPTAFVAHVIPGEKTQPKIGILMEYDALPDIGHACGHCASGSLSLLAALTLKEMAPTVSATIDLIGTPNEEATGDKITMANAGVFDDYAFVMMIHMNSDQTWPACRFLALSEIKATFTGQTAHAAAAPWQGKNALNGAMLACHAIDMARQQMKDGSRVSYILPQGGTASNVIVDKAELIINMRHANKYDLAENFSKVINCLEGAAQATETSVTYEKTGEDFDDMNLNAPGIAAIDEIMTAIELPHCDEPAGNATGSSDIGNVSYICPAFHPMMAISDHWFSLHTKEVATIMQTPSKIHPVILGGAKVIGLFILKTLSDQKLMESIQAAFQASLKD